MSHHTKKENLTITHKKSLLKKNLTYSSIFKVYFMKSFAAAKASFAFIKNRCRSSFFKIGVIKNLAWSNPRKFSFPSQTKYSPPIITFVHGVNPYLENVFQMIRISDLPPIPLIRSAERIRGIAGKF